MSATVGNLLDPANPSPHSLSSPKFFDFDIAVVGLGFHHFEDPFLAAKILTERLKKGGVLMIIDFLPHEHFHGGHHHNPAAHTVMHMGFKEEEVRKMFGDAGAGGGFEYVVVGKEIVFTDATENGEDLKRSVFMARGAKL